MPDAQSGENGTWRHTDWFFETVILAKQPVTSRRSAFRLLFNSYYEALGPRHPPAARGLLSRPSLDEILRLSRPHRRRDVTICDDATLRDRNPCGSEPRTTASGVDLTDIKHAFFSNPLLPAYRPIRGRCTRRKSWNGVP
jgi:hypothetical protein